MAGSSIELAAASAASFSQVLDGLNVRHEVLAFTTGDDVESSAVSAVREGKFDRVTPLLHVVVKPEGKSFHSCREDFAKLAYRSPLNQNVDGEAVVWAAQRLNAMRKPGDKAALIVFSDGMPASLWEKRGKLNDHLKDAVKRVSDAGIEPIGVGIMSGSVRRFYPKNVVVHEISELSGELMTILGEVLAGSVR